MIVIRTEDLGADIVNAKRLKNSTNGSAGDNACTFGCRLEQDAACAVFADQSRAAECRR